MKFQKLTLLLLIAVTCLVCAQVEIQEHEVEMDCHNDSVKVDGQLSGRNIDDYVFKVCGNQKAHILLDTPQASLDYNVTKQGASKALFIGAKEGKEMKNTLNEGTYLVRLYLMGSASQSSEAHPYSLTIALGGKRTPKPRNNEGVKEEQQGQDEQVIESDFEDTVTAQGISFTVSMTDNIMTIKPKGLQISNTPRTLKVKGQVKQIKTTDLDGNGSPELFVVTKHESTEFLYGFGTNNKRSMSDIYIPRVADMPRYQDVYADRDSYTFTNDTVERTFPTFIPGKGQGTPVKLIYSLVAGEAGWALELD